MTFKLSVAIYMIRTLKKFILIQLFIIQKKLFDGMQKYQNNGSINKCVQFWGKF